MAQTVRDENIAPKGCVQMTSLGTATTLSSIPSNAKAALIQAESQNVRWRDDGTAPTTGIGMQIAAGASIYYTGELSALKVIEEAASAKLNIAYYG